MVKIRPLSIELQKKANEELNEINDRIPEDLEHIRKWLSKQPHLKVRPDDQWLVTFLRGCKFSLEKAKAKLDMYYSIRTILPEYFSNRFPYSAGMRGILDNGCFAVLPQSATSLNPTILFMRWNDNHENCTLTDFFKLWLMAIEILMHENDRTIVSGIQIIHDYSGFTLNYASQLSPAVIKKIALCLEKTYPIRIKGIFAINAPAIFETIFSVAKLIFSKKLENKLFLYSAGSIEEFYKEIPKRILPKEYGGENVSFEELSAEYSKKLTAYGEWFLDDETYKSDEALRPSTNKSPSDILGIEGSFRKLNVD